jgi:hypothetical protein
LIEQLGYQFTLLLAKNAVSELEKQQLASHLIQLIEVDSANNQPISHFYELQEDGAYLFTPDQYILGRWRNVQLNTVLDLVHQYLAGEVFEEESLIKTEQELIDEAVATTLRNCQRTNNLQLINN